jgi:TM2 domain-containing membrane protein YozV
MSTWPGEESAQYQTGPSEQAQAQPQPLPVPQGYQQPVQPMGQPVVYQHVQGRSAAVAVIASLFIPGLGSMLNEKVGKGILILACYIVAWVTTIVLIGFVLAPAVWIWGMVAANNDAHAWNRAHGILS